MTKLKLMAQHPENGYGVVEQKGTYRLIKQPFHMDNIVDIAETDLAELYAHGFEPTTLTFENYAQLHRHLSDLLKATRQQLGKPPEKFDAAAHYRELPVEFMAATIEILGEDLDKFKVVRLIYEALHANEEYPLLEQAAKDELEAIYAQATSRNYDQKKSTFPNADRDEVIDRINMEFVLLNHSLQIQKLAS